MQNSYFSENDRLNFFTILFLINENVEFIGTLISIFLFLNSIIHFIFSLLGDSSLGKFRPEKFIKNK